MDLFCVIYEVDKRRRRRERVVYDKKLVEIGHGICCYHIGIYKIGSTRDENELVNTLGRMCRHLVIQGDVYLPKNRNISAVETFEFVRDIMLYKLISTVARCDVASLAIKCGDMYFADKCVCIAKYVRDTRMISADGRILKNYRDRVFFLYGASVSDCESGCDTVFDFDEIKIKKRGVAYSFERIIPPREIADNIPENVNLLDFVAAAYKYCGQKKYLLEESRPIFSGGMDMEDIIL